MARRKSHDLNDFMRQLSREMSAEYERIQKRATEDPGTAGDQGEENWATLLRDWLPRTYQVVTKGRIIGQRGLTSAQVDVLVLDATYPKKLLDKKLYLAGGVAAAFECKTTLKASHIDKAMENCAQIKALYPVRTGTPYRELHSPVIYGLLTHSHSWKSARSNPVGKVVEKLAEADRQRISHPRYQLDLLCVADLGTWSSVALTFFGPNNFSPWAEMASMYGPNGSASSVYVGHTRKHNEHAPHFEPVGTLISKLSRKLAWQNPALRSMADYYGAVNIAGSGSGNQRQWPITIYSKQIQQRVQAGPLEKNPWSWDEWSSSFV